MKKALSILGAPVFAFLFIAIILNHAASKQSKKSSNTANVVGGCVVGAILGAAVFYGFSH